MEVTVIVNRMLEFVTLVTLILRILNEAKLFYHITSMERDLMLARVHHPPSLARWIVQGGMLHTKMLVSLYRFVFSD